MKPGWIMLVLCMGLIAVVINFKNHTIVDSNTVDKNLVLDFNNNSKRTITVGKVETIVQLINFKTVYGEENFKIILDENNLYKDFLIIQSYKNIIGKYEDGKINYVTSNSAVEKKDINNSYLNDALVRSLYGIKKINANDSNYKRMKINRVFSNVNLTETGEHFFTEENLEANLDVKDDYFFINEQNSGFVLTIMLAIIFGIFFAISCVVCYLGGMKIDKRLGMLTLITFFMSIYFYAAAHTIDIEYYDEVLFRRIEQTAFYCILFCILFFIKQNFVNRKVVMFMNINAWINVIVFIVALAVLPNSSKNFLDNEGLLLKIISLEEVILFILYAISLWVYKISATKRLIKLTIFTIIIYFLMRSNQYNLLYNRALDVSVVIIVVYLYYEVFKNLLQDNRALVKNDEYNKYHATSLKNLSLSIFRMGEKRKLAEIIELSIKSLKDLYTKEISICVFGIKNKKLKIYGATKDFKDKENKRNENEIYEHVKSLEEPFGNIIEDNENSIIYNEYEVISKIGIFNKTDMYIYIATTNKFNKFEKQLLQVFMYNFTNSVKNIEISRLTIKNQCDSILSLCKVLDQRTLNRTNSYNIYHITKIICQKIDVDEIYVEDVSLASCLINVGKFAIHDEILKDEQLYDFSAAEGMLHKYTDEALELLSKTNSVIVKIAYNIAKDFYEAYDGKGKDGKKGEEIYLYSRVAKIVHTFDELVNKCNKKGACVLDNCIQDLVSQSGHLYDPGILEVLIDSKEEIGVFYKKINKNIDIFDIL